MMIVHRIVRDHGGTSELTANRMREQSLPQISPKSPRHRLLESNELQEITKPNETQLTYRRRRAAHPRRLGTSPRGQIRSFLASNPEEAFNAIEAEKFEVVLTDLRMSGQSG